MNADERSSDLRHPRLSALRKAVRNNIVRWSGFQNRLSVGFEPGVPVDFAAVVADAEDDPRMYAVARKITM